MKNFLSLLIAFAIFPALAAPRAMQDWIVDLSEDYSEAYTYNETKSMFGMICYEKCIFYISPANITCNEDSEYSILMNAESDARAVDGKCVKIENKFVRVFQDFDAIFNAVRDSGYIGFAFSIKGGAFNVSRFSLKGSQTAIKQALEYSIKRKGSKKSSNRDMRL